MCRPPSCRSPCFPSGNPQPRRGTAQPVAVDQGPDSDREEDGRQSCMCREASCAKSTQGLAAHAQMCVKASVGWQVVRRHVAEVALAYHVSLVVRLLQLGLSQRAR